MKVSAATDTVTSTEDRAKAITALPPLPATAQEILTCFGDEFIDAQKVTSIVAGDPGICAKLLGLANSAYFGLSEPVTSMAEVISRVLGVDTVRSLALAMAMQRSFDSKRCPHFDAQRFWVRSLTTAECCKRLASADANSTDEIKDVAYSAGLCHNLGLMALAHTQPDRTDAALALHGENTGENLGVLLESHCGTSHRAMTAQLASHWSLPESMVEAYAYRVSPNTSPATGLASILAAAALSIEHAGADVETTDEFRSLAGALGMSVEDLQKAGTFGERQKNRVRALAGNMSG